jgi:hypothetical protein
MILKSIVLCHVCWKPELWSQHRQPLLGNGSAKTLIPRQCSRQTSMQQQKNCRELCLHLSMQVPLYIVELCGSLCFVKMYNMCISATLMWPRVEARCSKGTPIKKKSNPSLFIKGGTTKEGIKNKSLDIEQIYGHGSQRGSMPGVTCWLVAGSKLLLCSALLLVR